MGRITIHVFMGYDHRPPWKMYREHIKPWMERSMAMIDATDNKSLYTIGWRNEFNHHYYLFMSLDKYSEADQERARQYMKENT